MRLSRPRVLIWPGSVLLTFGLLAGIVNHEILDGSRFADHVDSIRKDPDVAREVGQVMTARIVAAQPDLVAVRPLLEAATVAFAGSSAFGPIVRTSAAQAHKAFTGPTPVALRVADIGAVLAGVVQSVAPEAAAQLPQDLDVTLAQVGSQSFASDTIHLTHVVRVLAWLLPLLALLCLATAVLLSADRRRAAIDAGRGVCWVGGVLVGIAVAARIAASFFDTDTLSGALIAASLQELSRPLWWTGAGALAGGGLLALAAAHQPGLDVLGVSSASWKWLTGRTGATRERLARIVVWVLLGCGLILRPVEMVTAAAVIAGVACLIYVISELWQLVKESRSGARMSRTGSTRGAGWTRITAAVGGVALLAAVLVVLARPVDSDIAAAQPVAGDPLACNGHVELCDRAYDKVAYGATHNSMSAVDHPNWFFPEQPTGLIGQLDDGIRVLLIDTWYGQTTQRPGVVATAAKNREAALTELEAAYGKSVVESAMRLRDAASLTPTGPVEPYLCHGYCELGSVKLQPELESVRGWLESHPREVVSLFIQDEVSPADTAEIFDEAGLTPYVHTQQPGEAWPTLGDMVDSGRRLVVLMENQGGGSTYPWLLQGFDWVQDTPFDSLKQSDFDCSRLRGSADSPLFLVNHWLNNHGSRVSDAAKVNAYDVLWPRVETCQRQRDMIPNFVAVDFYDQGDLLAVVDQLNGLD